MTLLFFAITLPLHSPARSKPPDGDNGLPDLQQHLEEFLRRSHPAEAERHREEEERKRLLRMIMERDRVYEKMQSLAAVGPLFVFEAIDGVHPLQRLRAACLVGETGKIYMDDFTKDGAQAPSGADGRESSKAVNLAKSLEQLEWRPVLARALEHGADIRQLAWYVLLDGRSIPLQIAGDYVGAHPNPQVAELVKLIDSWCPHGRRSDEDLSCRLLGSSSASLYAVSVHTRECCIAPRSTVGAFLRRAATSTGCVHLPTNVGFPFGDPPVREGPRCDSPMYARAVCKLSRLQFLEVSYYRVSVDSLHAASASVSGGLPVPRQQFESVDRMPASGPSAVAGVSKRGSHWTSECPESRILACPSEGWRRED